jgi:hypothetical protein
MKRSKNYTSSNARIKKQKTNKKNYDSKFKYPVYKQKKYLFNNSKKFSRDQFLLTVTEP